jgi:MFS family permease
MVLGRGIFGIGAEWTYVAVPLIVFKWFKGKEVTQALGIAQCFPYLVSYSTGSIIPPYFKKYGFTQTFALGSLFCFASLMAGLKVSL